MRYQTYGKLAALAFALILVSFVILGFSRIVLPYRTARMLAAPTLFLAVPLVLYLFIRAILSWIGVSRIE
jgi:hypothetical protein